MAGGYSLELLKGIFPTLWKNSPLSKREWGQSKKKKSEETGKAYVHIHALPCAPVSNDTSGTSRWHEQTALLAYVNLCWVSVTCNQGFWLAHFFKMGCLADRQMSCTATSLKSRRFEVYCLDLASLVRKSRIKSIPKVRCPSEAS